MTAATVTGDDVTQNLDEIKTDLKNIEAAQGELSSDRRSEAEAANKEFTSSVQGIAERARQLAVGLGREGPARHRAGPARGVLPEGFEPAELRLGRNLEMADRPVFLYAAIYDEIDDAEADYEAVLDLHAAGAIGTFDSAVIRKEDDGKVRVRRPRSRRSTAPGPGPQSGAGGDHLPAAVLGAAVVGAGAGGLTGHLTKGDLDEATSRTRRGARRGQRRRDRARRVEDRGAARAARSGPTSCSRRGDEDARRRRARSARSTRRQASGAPICRAADGP